MMAATDHSTVEGLQMQQPSMHGASQLYKCFACKCQKFCCAWQGGWNRWAHLKKFGPLKMTPPAEGQHFNATVAVPKNAHSIDFVLSNVPEGEGIYDNRGGLDYHMPVEGSEVCRPLIFSLNICAS